MPLKYLFTVKYKDGCIYQQTQEDRSFIEPEKRSAFYDVQHDAVETFTLVGDGHSYSVDLTDGHFEKDGEVLMSEPMEEGLTNFRVIFWRKHTVTGTSQEDMVDTIVGYQLGWQANDKEGKNVQRTLDIL